MRASLVGADACEAFLSPARRQEEKIYFELEYLQVFTLKQLTVLVNIIQVLFNMRLLNAFLHTVVSVAAGKPFWHKLIRQFHVNKLEISHEIIVTLKNTQQIMHKQFHSNIVFVKLDPKL